MTSKHHKWQTRWRLDAAGADAVATHDNGLRVRLAGTQAVADNHAEVAATLAPQHGLHNTPQMLARLVREGAQLLSRARAGGHHGA